MKCASFFEELRRIMDLTLLAVEKIHSSGIVIGDISPSNIIYNRDIQKIYIVDLEVAEYISEISQEKTFGLSTPGYCAPRSDKQLSPIQIDMYKLGLVFLHCIMPYDGLIDLCPDKAFELLDSYRLNNIVPLWIISAISSLLSGRFASIKEMLLRLSTSPELLTAVGYEKSYVSYKAVVSEVKNNIRMFLNKRGQPLGNDPMGSLTNDYSWGYGIFGMMYVIKRLTPMENDMHLANDAVHAFMYDFYQNPDKYTAGLYIGLSGIAFSLCELGYESEAQTIMEYAVRKDCPIYDVAYGKAGRVSALLYFFNKNGEKKYLDWAMADINSIVDNYQVIDDVLLWPDTEESCYSGLTRGNAGIALVLLQTYMVTKDVRLLNFGVKVINSALAHIEELDNGFIGFNSRPAGYDSKVYSPYVHNGLAGLGIVLVRYYCITKDDNYVAFIMKIIKAVEHKYLLHSGYLTGISGILSFLQDCKYILRFSNCDSIICDLLENLSFQYVGTNGYVGFAGDQSFKISHDILTGSMGAFLAINRSRTSKQANPFIMLDDMFFSDGDTIKS